MTQSTVRNSVIFALTAASAGWIGLGLNRAMGVSDPIQNLGMLDFLLLPFVTGLLLRAWGGDGWKLDLLRLNAVGYGVALLSYPVITTIVLVVGHLADGVTLEGFAQADMATAGSLETFEQIAAHTARLHNLFYATYLNAALLTVIAVALFAVLYACLKPTARLIGSSPGLPLSQSMVHST